MQLCLEKKLYHTSTLRSAKNAQICMLVDQSADLRKRFNEFVEVVERKCRCSEMISLANREQNHSIGKQSEENVEKIKEQGNRNMIKNVEYEKNTVPILKSFSIERPGFEKFSFQSGQNLFFAEKSYAFWKTF